MYFFAVLTLDGYLLAPRRAQFDLETDTYESWSLLVPRNGSFAVEISGAPYAVATFGDIVICPPGGTLWRRMRTPAAFFHARFDTELEPPIGRTRLPDLDRLRTNLAMLESTDSRTDLIATHVVTDLVLMALRAPRGEPTDELMDQAVAVILDNFTSPDLSLGELATILGISAAQLSRRFRAARGVTPIAYLRDLRLRKARELLAETDATLRTVAERSGYRSAFYLSRVFTSQTGHSPSHYRRTTRV
jgi:AraC-like DNA-binding protein